MELFEQKEEGFFPKEEYKPQINQVLRRLAKISATIDLSAAEYSCWLTNKNNLVVSVRTPFQGFLIYHNHTLEVTNYKGEINMSEI